MTYKEKLKIEYPSMLCKGMPGNCPNTFGYEEYDNRPCKGVGIFENGICEKCWSREIPEEPETKNDIGEDVSEQEMMLLKKIVDETPHNNVMVSAKFLQKLIKAAEANGVKK